MMTPKKALIFTLMIGLLAVAAYAQDEDPVQTKPEEAVKAQTAERTSAFTESEAQGTATREQTFNGPEAKAAPAEDEDPVEGDEEKSAADQTGEAVKQRELNYEDAPGVDANGGIVRNGAEFAEEGGPHGPFGSAAEDGEVAGEETEKVFIDEDGEVAGEGTEKVFIDEDGDGICDTMQSYGENGTGVMNQNGALERNRHMHDPATGGPFDGSSACDGTGTQDGESGDAVRERGSRRK